jgi:cation-transporting ATPase 13A1
MGGLRVADVGVAVIGTTTITEQERKEDEFKEEEARFKEKIREVQMDPRTTFGKKMEQMKKLNQEFMLKKKENMFQPDDEAKAGDACFAAPFTSKHSNSIKCVLIILRQAIATIVTTIQTYKILAISSMIQAYSLAEMNLTNLKYSQTQTLVIGILASINLYYFSNAKPLNRISEIRAPHTIFSIWFGISFFGQILIFLFCNYYALNWIGLKYMLD